MDQATTSPIQIQVNKIHTGHYNKQLLENN